MTPLHCPYCRYDIGALPVARICPECGKIVRDSAGIPIVVRRHWAWNLLFALIPLGIATVAGVASGRIDGAMVAIFGAGVPGALLIAAFIVLLNAGKLARRYCGYCGYDRTGLDAKTLCPECGRDGLASDAPGHRAVGARRVPWWVVMPAMVGLVAGFSVADTPSRYDWGVIVFFGGIGLTAVAATYHAWKQAG